MIQFLFLFFLFLCVFLIILLSTMAEIYTDESRTGQERDMMSVRIIYRKIDSSSSSVNLSFDSKKYCFFLTVYK